MNFMGFFGYKILFIFFLGYLLTDLIVRIGARSLRVKVTIIELLCFLYSTKLYQNHHTKFEIKRIILTFIELKGQRS